MILVAFTAFSAPAPDAAERRLAPLRFEGQLDEIVLEASLTHQHHKYVIRLCPLLHSYMAHTQNSSAYQYIVFVAVHLLHL